MVDATTKPAPKRKSRKLLPATDADIAVEVAAAGNQPYRSHANEGHIGAPAVRSQDPTLDDALGRMLAPFRPAASAQEAGREGSTAAVGQAQGSRRGKGGKGNKGNKGGKGNRSRRRR